MGKTISIYEAPKVQLQGAKRVSELTFIKETSRLASFATLKKQECANHSGESEIFESVPSLFCWWECRSEVILSEL